MYKLIIDKIKPNLEKAIAHFKEELAALRTGRATPALIENIEVECYGVRNPLKQLAAITAPEARVLVIQPWDINILKEIETALRKARPGLGLTLTGELIRVNIPPLNEESRKELVRVLSQKAEAARMAVRYCREQAWKEIQESEKEGKIREDDKFRGKDALQKVIDDYNKKIEEMRAAKEEEIMKI